MYALMQSECLGQGIMFRRCTLPRPLQPLVGKKSWGAKELSICSLKFCNPNLEGELWHAKFPAKSHSMDCNSMFVPKALR